MKVLIVFAHPEERSFSAALKERAVATLEDEGHEVVVSDLYRMEWRACLGPADFEVDREDPCYLDVSREQEHSFRAGTTDLDVAAEQTKVADADLVIFHFPIWWFSMPAILKGLPAQCGRPEPSRSPGLGTIQRHRSRRPGAPTPDVFDAYASAHPQD